MRNLVWCLIGFAFLSGGCLKDNSRCSPNGSVAPDPEIRMVQEYINNNGIVATRHSSGLFYTVISEGIGSTPNVCSTVKAVFTGRLTNGTQVEYDKGETLINMKLTVNGWQIGVPLIKSGGKIKLYVPPSLAYGANGKTDNGAVVIPANSMVIYDISLILVE